MKKRPVKIRITVYPRGMFIKRHHITRFGVAPATLLMDLFYGNSMVADDARINIFRQFYGPETPSLTYISSKRFCVEIDPADEKKWLNYSRKNTVMKPHKTLIERLKITGV